MVARPFRSRKPKSSPLWKCFHAHFDHFTAAYPRDYQSRYGVLRGVIPEVVDKFMGCGDFAKGFARVRCDECSHEYLLALFLQRRVGSARHAIRKRCKYSAPCLRSRSSRSCRIGISRSRFQKCCGISCALAEDVCARYLHATLEKRSPINVRRNPPYIISLSKDLPSGLCNKACASWLAFPMQELRLDLCSRTRQSSECSFPCVH